MVIIAKPKVKLCPVPGACESWFWRYNGQPVCLYNTTDEEGCPLKLTGNEEKPSMAEVKSWSEYY